MTYPLDTDVVADWLQGRPAAVQLISSLVQEGLAISLVTDGEIYDGIYGGRNPKQSEQGFREFLRIVDVLPLNRRIMRRFARIRGDLRRSGMIIGDPDILIAATAIDRELTLVTGNTRHFGRIADLNIHS